MLSVHLNAISKKIRNLRKKEGISQIEAARKSGISPRYYQEIEASRVNMTVGTLLKLAKAFQVRIQTLLSNCPKPK